MDVWRVKTQYFRRYDFSNKASLSLMVMHFSGNTFLALVVLRVKCTATNLRLIKNPSTPIERVELCKCGRSVTGSISHILFGGILIGIGLYALIDKWHSTGLLKLDTVYDIILNISLLMVLGGAVVFVVSFAGCVGALRENTCLLKFYSLCLLVLFLVEMGCAVGGFVFPRTLNGLLRLSFTDRVVHLYRDDPDLQNFIDFAQSDFHCCGLSSEGYMDWSKNEYFNCSSPSVEKCGVPFSCCVNATDISSGLVNIMCGYGAQNLSVAEASKKVWTSGCIEIIRSWAERNLYTIATIALGVALSQLFVIYLAKTLEGQIELQKSRWSS